MTVATHRNPWRSRLRAAATVTILLLVSFSPSVAWHVSQVYARWQSQAERVQTWQLPPLAPVTLNVNRSYAPFMAEYEATLDALKINPRRRVRLLEDHFAVYRRARMVFGPAQANAMLRMISAETKNQETALGRRSVFSSPEAALANAQVWLGFASTALRDLDRRDSRALARQLRALSPAPMAPEAVFHNAQWIRRAAHNTRLPPAMLAAVVDTEQAGEHLAYGLSGALRSFTDTAALRTTQLYGSSGMTGALSKTVGLAQMSWEDALGQQRRLEALGVQLGVPFPENEAEARRLLSRPYANLLLTSSRVLGYLNHSAGVGPNSTVGHSDAWVYFLGPGWHNNPALASSGQTWPYAWNAFFKACIYERLLP